MSETREDIEGAMNAPTYKWMNDVRGNDSRIAIGACLNILTTIGNYSPPDVRSATAMFLRRVAGELESKRGEH